MLNWWKKNGLIAGSSILMISSMAFSQSPPPQPPAAPSAPPAAAAPAPPVAAPAPSPAASPTSGSDVVLQRRSNINLLEGIIEDYVYSPVNKRDPFKPFEEGVGLQKVVTAAPISEPMLPLEKFDLDQLRLVGIIWGGRSPKAMFLDPTDRTHIVRKNERVGRNRGYVAAIREGEVVVIEPFEREGVVTYSTKVLKLQKAEKKK